ncbi:MAG: peroxiredoxin [Alicyclobacillus sp. RIFOXYA1_FULL_53_8]|nr:MAG: peroxiredoxin [Alicyclobacillus sp. RIFOXYA1_FULL_53_8]
MTTGQNIDGNPPVQTEGHRAILRIGELAPQFEAPTTHGKIKLSDYKGKWVVLFSHPADFTPVCTTEFMAFAERNEEFTQRNVSLIGLSIDSVYSHLAWVHNIYEKMGVEIPFPVIADLNMEVANLYGMIHPAASETATVRSVFIIDDKQIVRAIIYYPLTSGRNMDEILRLVDSLQTVDQHAVATPANWRPGDKVIVPAPLTYDALKKRLEEDQGFDCSDWYLCKKSL